MGVADSTKVLVLRCIYLLPFLFIFKNLVVCNGESLVIPSKINVTGEFCSIAHAPY